MTDHESERILQMPILSQSLPFKFTNSSEVSGLAIACSCCGTDVNEKDIRGEFTATNNHSAALKAYALCYTCRMMTPVELRFADDGSYLAKVETGWIKGRYANDQPVGWFTRLKELIEGGIR